MSSNNLIKISAAGAGKTWDICHDALETVTNHSKRVLITTYTNRGAESIRNEVRKQNLGVLSSNIVIKTWYEFLMADLIRPYQSAMRGIRINEIRGLDFSKMYGNVNFGKSGDKKRYITDGHNVRSNAASELVIYLNKLSDGRVIHRLESIYDKIYFDEIQDLCGNDIEIIRALIQSSIGIICCGDNKQATYSTHNAKKNKKLTGSNIWMFFDGLQNNNLVQIQKKLVSRRFNQQICNFANKVFPIGDQITTCMTDTTEHDGVYLINSTDVKAYYDYFTPQVLKFDARTKSGNYHSVNFGACKGETFDRVLIYPNKVFLDFLLKGTNISSPEKYYVAATRPRYSLAFVLDKFPQKDVAEFVDTEIELNNGIRINAYKYATSKCLY